MSLVDPAKRERPFVEEAGAQHSQEEISKVQKSRFGRVVQWICDNNTYIPVLSTITGAVKAVAGVFMSLGGVVTLGVGLGMKGISLLGKKKPTYFPGVPDVSTDALVVKVGKVLIKNGILEVARGSVSAVPIAGNAIVKAVDLVWEREEPFRLKPGEERSLDHIAHCIKKIQSACGENKMFDTYPDV